MPVGLSVLDIETDIINPLNTNTVDINGAKIKGDLTGFSVYVGDIDKASLPTESVLIGSEAGNNLSSGIGNTVIGSKAMYSPVSSSGNVCVGTTSGYSLSIGGGNTLLGNSSGYGITTGSGNTCLGNGTGGTITTGGNNTFIGTNAGNASSGYSPFIGGNNICIGGNSFLSASNVFNEITLGNFAITALRCAVTSITSLSDERDKDEIKDLSAGLDFINEIKPVSFVWKDRDENGKKGIKDSGFTAQNLKEVQEKYNLSEELKLVYESNPEKLEASYGRLIPILVKAIQELSDKFKELEAK
jgi:hypothetical protein